MNIVTVNPLLTLVGDQFQDVFGEGVLPAVQDAELAKLRTITASLQAMSPHMKALGDGLRHPTDEELIDKGVNLGQELSELHRALKYKVPSQFDAEIEQNLDLLHDVLNNLAGIRMHYFAAVNAPACDCGKCDSCLAAQSDEAYDRYRDHQLCDEA